tara:strand:- start:5374 stop:5592 length:219 start_codon:yes stop_codon:yes gene_type:complete
MKPTKPKMVFAVFKKIKRSIKDHESPYKEFLKIRLLFKIINAILAVKKVKKTESTLMLIRVRLKIVLVYKSL